MKFYSPEKFKLIVSLTSYPKRIDLVHIALKSIFDQTIKPYKVVLCLSYEEFPNKEKDLPSSILAFYNKNFEIIWCKNIKSYKKLIPTLKKYPNDIIVTADDDITYKKDWLELLCKIHSKHKNNIICHRSHLVTFKNGHKINEYNNWVRCWGHKLTSFKLLPTSGGGVLYPPNSFNSEIFNEKSFLKNAPTADDLWFWAMAVLNKTKVTNIGKKGYSEINTIKGTQKESLSHINLDNFQNDIQLNNLFIKYPLFKKRVFSRLDIKYYFYRLLSRISKILRK